MSKLTDNQEAFAKFLALGHHRCDAFVKAGYSAKGAESNSYSLMKTPKVAARITELKKILADGGDIELPVEPIASEAPYTSPWDPKAAPNFDKPQMNWLRRELYENMTAARNDGDYKAANQAAQLLMETMFTSTVKPAKPGRPRGENLTNKGDDSNDKPERTVNVQIFNKIAQQLDRAARNESEAQEVVVTESGEPDRVALRDHRSEQPAFSFGGAEGDVREGVYVEVEGSSTE